jgi:hypothetical protein
VLFLCRWTSKTGIASSPSAACQQLCYPADDILLFGHSCGLCNQ